MPYRRAGRAGRAGLLGSMVAWAHPLAGLAIVGVLVWRMGAGPFLAGLRTIDLGSLGTAAGIGFLTTVCCAWRWRLVARGLGVEVPLRAAVAAYYRSQLLNQTLPGGVLGDVHRGVRHGRDVGDLGLGLRAVAWERAAGQGVQIVLTLLVLLALPSPMRSSASAVAAVLVALLAGGVVARIGHRSHVARGTSLPAPALRVKDLRVQALRTAAADLRHGVLARSAWPYIALASVLVVAGHAGTFLIAAHTAGATASPPRLLPLTMVVLLAMAVPTNIGGWGPREGAAGWAFGLAGLGAAQGVATAVVYGVMALVASLPGAAIPLVAWLRRHAAERPSSHPARRFSAAVARVGGVRSG